MKRCPACGRDKPRSAFGSNGARKDGLQSYCWDCRRAYLRRHYRDNAIEYRALAARRNLRRRNAIRDIIREAKDRPCADCGTLYPRYVMDFDHRDTATKRYNIGRDALSKLSPEMVLGEIAKCDVVCANCHRIRTHAKRH
jgi:hypothetical protein